MIHIPLRNRAGEVVAHALIDDEDAHFAEQRWHYSGRYVKRRLPRDEFGQRKTQYLHREILGLTQSRTAAIEPVALAAIEPVALAVIAFQTVARRVVTRSSNAQNVPSRGGSSKYRGVYWQKDCQKWRAQVMINGRHRHLGYFVSEIEAHEVCQAFRLQHMPFTNEARCERPNESEDAI